MPLQFVRFPEDGPIEAGVWVKAAEVAAWLDEHGVGDLAELLRSIEDAPATGVTELIL